MMAETCFWPLEPAGPPSKEKVQSKRLVSWGHLNAPVKRQSTDPGETQIIRLLTVPFREHEVSKSKKEKGEEEEEGK